MNDIHRVVLRHIRDNLTSQPNEITNKLVSMSDEQLVRMMFSNFRGKTDSRGMRLTNFGLQIMRSVFQSYEISLPDGHKLRAPEILYLDHRAALPYFVSDKQIIVFESKLGMKIRLADGDIMTLIEIETPDKQNFGNENT